MKKTIKGEVKLTSLPHGGWRFVTKSGITYDSHVIFTIEQALGIRCELGDKYKVTIEKIEDK